MTEVQAGIPAETVPAEPQERGRYAVYGQADGGLLIARATGLCERCQSCGCGEQAAPVGPIPGGLVQMARMAAAGKVRMPSVAQLKQLAGSKGPRGGRR
jgi:hypothetical protein